MFLKNNLISKFIKSQLLTLSRIINVGSSYLFLIIASNYFLYNIIGFSYIIISFLTNLSLFSQLGFDFLIIRFKNQPYIEQSRNLMFLITTFIAIISSLIGSIIILNINLGRRVLSGISSSMLFILISIIFTVSLTSGTIIDAIGIASYKNHLVLLRSLLTAGIQIGFLIFYIFFINIQKSFILVLIYSISFLIGLISILPFYLNKKKFVLKIDLIKSKEGFKNLFKKSQKIVKKYTYISYLSDLLLKTPGYLFPLFIGIIINEEFAAYFYVAWIMTNFLNMISLSLSQTLVAKEREGEGNFLKRNIKLLLLTFITIILLTAILIVFRDLILSTFGVDFINASSALIILSLSTLIVFFNYLLDTYFRIKLNVKGLFILNSIISFLSISLGLLLLLEYKNIFYVGITWLISNGIALILSLIFIRINKNL